MEAPFYAESMEAPHFAEHLGTLGKRMKARTFQHLENEGAGVFNVYEGVLLCQRLPTLGVWR